MDWVTQDRLDAGKANEPTQARKPSKRHALGLPNSEAGLIPAADGKRVLVTQPWQGSKRKSSPCVSYTVDDPTPRLFAPTRERHGSKATPVTVAKVPEVARYGLTNNIGQDYS